MNRRPCGRPKKRGGKIWTSSMDVQPLTSRVAEWKSPSLRRNREVPYHKGTGCTSRMQSQPALYQGKVGIGRFSRTKEKSRTWSACAPVPAKFSEMRNGKEDAMLKEQMKQNQMSCQPQWKSEISSYEPVDAETLLATPLPPVRWLVPDLLPTGLSLLAGASKTGKSWLCLWLCLQLAQGGEIWGKQVQPQTVLYLSLEDTPKRIQNRLSQLTEAPVPSRLYFQTRCEAIGEGLEFELELFLAKYPETGLIVIDTLQKVRIDTQNSGVYAGDYQDMSALKSLADRHNVGILVVHHLRKQGANDPFLQISGSNGLMGAADTILLLQRQRMNSTAKLLVTGRDMDSRTLRLQWDGCLWNCTEETGAQEQEKQESRKAKRS